MHHHTPGISRRAEQLPCFHTALPWMWFANTEACEELLLHTLNTHTSPHASLKGSKVEELEG